MISAAKNALQSWFDNSPFTHSAAAAYFAVFSLPGLLIIVMSIMTFFLDEALVRSQIQNHIGNFIGEDFAKSVQDIIDHARLSGDGFWTLLIGGGILLFGASGLFNQLKRSFNAIWGVKARHNINILWAFANRVVAMGVAVMIGFLLLLSMYLSAAFKLFGSWLTKEFPDLGFLQTLEIFASFLTISILFMLIFKVLPDIYIKLKYAFISGMLCSFLFMFGEIAFAKALEIFSPHSVFGAAGSIVLLMVWVNYGCMILQLGAEFIKALMLQHEDEIKTTRFVKLKR